MSVVNFIPLMLASLALAFVSWSKNKSKLGWMLIAIVFWIMTFFWAIGVRLT